LGYKADHINDETNKETISINTQSQQETKEEDQGTQQPQLIQQIMNQYHSSPVTNRGGPVLTMCLQ
jgi:hypothetical protein